VVPYIFDLIGVATQEFCCYGRNGGKRALSSNPLVWSRGNWL